MIEAVNKQKLNPIVTELFIRGGKSNVIVFITQSYFKLPKKFRLKSTHF